MLEQFTYVLVVGIDEYETEVDMITEETLKFQNNNSPLWSRINETSYEEIERNNQIIRYNITIEFEPK